MAYAINEVIWHRGEEITITTEPYSQFDVLWQDGITCSGRIVTVKTPGQIVADVARKRAEWRDQQNAFSRLKRLQKNRA